MQHTTAVQMVQDHKNMFNQCIGARQEAMPCNQPRDHLQIHHGKLQLRSAQPPQCVWTVGLRTSCCKAIFNCFLQKPHLGNHLLTKQRRSLHITAHVLTKKHCKPEDMIPIITLRVNLLHSRRGHAHVAQSC